MQLLHETLRRMLLASQITAFDVTQGGGLGVSVSLDGSCKVWDTATGDVRVRTNMYQTFNYYSVVPFSSCDCEKMP